MMPPRTVQTIMGHDSPPSFSLGEMAAFSLWRETYGSWIRVEARSEAIHGMTDSSNLSLTASEARGGDREKKGTVLSRLL